mmetsp:Transcript_64856/g.180554  ORF Transcript_64856/g.180554 Transcript_64856/m.180554 type:complete len:233 (-) Transcript_64856:295-993(-)
MKLQVVHHAHEVARKQLARRGHRGEGRCEARGVCAVRGQEPQPIRKHDDEFRPKRKGLLSQGPAHHGVEQTSETLPCLQLPAVFQLVRQRRAERDGDGAEFRRGVVGAVGHTLRDAQKQPPAFASEGSASRQRPSHLRDFVGRQLVPSSEEARRNLGQRPLQNVGEPQLRQRVQGQNELGRGELGRHRSTEAALGEAQHLCSVAPAKVDVTTSAFVHGEPVQSLDEQAGRRG